MKYHFPFPPRTLRCNVSFNDIICPSVQLEQENMISCLQWALRVIFWRSKSAPLCFWGLFAFPVKLFSCPADRTVVCVYNESIRPKIRAVTIVCTGESR